MGDARSLLTNSMFLTLSVLTFVGLVTAALSAGTYMIAGIAFLYVAVLLIMTFNHWYTYLTVHMATSNFIGAVVGIVILGVAVFVGWYTKLFFG